MKITLIAFKVQRRLFPRVQLIASQHGSDETLALNMRYALIWTYGHLDYCHIHGNMFCCSVLDNHGVQILAHATTIVLCISTTFLTFIQLFARFGLDELTHLGLVMLECQWIRQSMVQVTASLFVSKPVMTSSNGNIFRVSGPLCGEFIGHRWLPRQRPVMRSFDVFCDLRLNKRLS